MKRILKVVSLLLIMILLLGSIPFAAETNRSSGSDYELIDKAIKSYFHLQLDTVKIKDTSKVDKLKDVVYTGIDSGKMDCQQ